jgi:hypothetical protein
LIESTGQDKEGYILMQGFWLLAFVVMVLALAVLVVHPANMVSFRKEQDKQDGEREAR